jgi:hypothetical protein
MTTVITRGLSPPSLRERARVGDADRGGRLEYPAAVSRAPVHPLPAPLLRGTLSASWRPAAGVIERTLDAIPPASGAVVMGTGIVSIALSLDAQETISRGVLVLAAVF